MAPGVFGCRSLEILLDHHAIPHVLMRHDQRTGFAVVLVSTRMVRVPVGVDDELHLLVRHGGDGGVDLLRQGRELIVHDERAVLSHGQPDVATCANEHVHSLRHADGPNLDVLYLSRQGTGGQPCEGQEHC